MKPLTLAIGFVCTSFLLGTDPYSECLQGQQHQAFSREVLRCIFGKATAYQTWREGNRLIEENERAFPGDPWAPYYRGHFLLKFDNAEAAEVFKRAAEGFEGKDMAVQAMKAWGRVSLAYLRADNDPGIAEVEARMVRLADQSQEDLAKAYGNFYLARRLLDQGVQLGKALALLDQAAQITFPDGPQDLKLQILEKQYEIYWELGLLGMVERNLNQYTSLAEELQYKKELALAQYRWATLSVLEIPTSEKQEKALGLAKEAYDLGLEIGSDNLAFAAQLMGKLTRDEERIDYLKKSIEYAEDKGNFVASSLAKALLACELGNSNFPEARRYLEESLIDQKKQDHIRASVYSWEQRMKARWCLLDPIEALENSKNELTSIEIMRANQVEERTQILLFKVWSRAYYWLSGRSLLEYQQQANPYFLKEAFDLAERVRARSLLENLDPTGNAPMRKAYQALEEKMADRASAFSQLSSKDLTQESRKQTHADLKTMEADIETLRQQVLDNMASDGGATQFASIEDVQAAMSTDEALLAFQMQPSNDFYDGFGGGTWLTVITRDGVTAHELPEFYSFVGKLELFLGLIEDPTTFEQSQKAVTLIYRDLFQNALETLPQEVTKLWIIPDQIVHKIPFGVLRAEEGAPMLAELFQLTTVPSATLWLKWRMERQINIQPSALSFSDPSLPNEQMPSIRSALRSQDEPLGRLPFARKEGQALLNHLGGGSKLLVGTQASEAFIKKADLSSYGLLHFATHAIGGDESMDESAVVLAPGQGEDGWLRPRDILKLQLNGQVVVLSACQSASGTIYQGEGVMGLGRAFFQAGAHVVVGSLWKLRDDEAADLFEAFYRHLARGLSVSQAVRQAQIDRMKAGAPVTAWSGVTVLGNGDLIPLPNGAQKPSKLWAWSLIGLCLVILALLVVRRKTSLSRAA